eukprot:SAG22_NODE_783_length_7251_cov_18.263423_2_plen_684_part_00
MEPLVVASAGGLPARRGGGPPPDPNPVPTAQGPSQGQPPAAGSGSGPAAAVEAACSAGIDDAFDAISAGHPAARGAHERTIAWEVIRDLSQPLMAAAGFDLTDSKSKAGLDLTDSKTKSMLATIKHRQLHPLLARPWSADKKHEMNYGEPLSAGQQDKAEREGYTPKTWPNRTGDGGHEKERAWKAGDKVGVCRANPDGQEAEIEAEVEDRDGRSTTYIVKFKQGGRRLCRVANADLSGLFHGHEKRPFDLHKKELLLFLTSAPRVRGWVAGFLEEPAEAAEPESAADSLPRGPSRAEAVNFYRVFDMIGDGSVSPSEWRYRLNSLHLRPTDREILSLAAHFDRDGTGMVSCDDFVQGVLSPPWQWRLQPPPRGPAARSVPERLLRKDHDRQNTWSLDPEVGEKRPKGLLSVAIMHANNLTPNDDSLVALHVPQPVVKLSYHHKTMLSGAHKANLWKLHDQSTDQTQPSHGPDPLWHQSAIQAEAVLRAEPLACPANTFLFGIDDTSSGAHEDSTEHEHTIFFHIWDHHQFGAERYLGQAALDLRQHLWWAAAGPGAGDTEELRGGCISPLKQPEAGTVITLQLGRFCDPYYEEGIESSSGSACSASSRAAGAAGAAGAAAADGGTYRVGHSPAHHNPRVQNHSGCVFRHCLSAVLPLSFRLRQCLSVRSDVTGSRRVRLRSG